VKLLLDTCALVWAISDPTALTPRAREALMADDTTVVVSPISCAEVACAVARGRLALDRHWKRWFRHFVELNVWRTVDIDLAIIEEAYSLPDPFHRDPADRILVATARVVSCKILTADRKILDYPHVETIW
jgi:PIN domain nuclease of toxin-antitoxin system